MKIFNQQNLKKSIQNIFNENLEYVERRKLTDLFVKTENDFFREIRDEKEDKMKYFAKNKISQFEGVKELSKLYQAFDVKKRIFMESKGKEFSKEYEEKYNNPIVVEGLISDLEFDLKPTIYKELSLEEQIKYKKDYSMGSFVLEFTYEDSIKIKVNEGSRRFLTAIIEPSINNEHMTLRFFEIATRNIKLDINSKDEIIKSYLESLKEDDLLLLDSKEKEDYFLILSDFKIDLKDEPLYEMFKMGVSDFSILIKKGLSLNNNKNVKKVTI